MKLSSRSKLILVFGVGVICVLTLYMALGAAVVHLITAAYDQIVLDFGTPK